MDVLVYGAGVLGTVYSAGLHDAGHRVSLLARGERLAALRRHGVQLAEGSGPAVRRVPVPVVERPAEGYDLVLVPVRTHQVEAVLESLVDVGGDVLLLANWAGGAQPLGAVIDRERLLLGAPTVGGRLDGHVVRHRAPSAVTRLLPMPIGEPDGRATARLERVVRVFRAAGFPAAAEPRMDAWLRTHAAFEVPLGRAVEAAGGPLALADDPRAVQEVVRRIRRELAALSTPVVPRGFVALRTLPEGLLVAALRRFLRSAVVAYSGLTDAPPAAAAELDRLADQLRAIR